MLSTIIPRLPLELLHDTAHLAARQLQVGGLSTLLAPIQELKDGVVVWVLKLQHTHTRHIVPARECLCLWDHWAGSHSLLNTICVNVRFVECCPAEPRIFSMVSGYGRGGTGAGAEDGRGRYARNGAVARSSDAGVRCVAAGAYRGWAKRWWWASVGQCTLWQGIKHSRKSTRVVSGKGARLSRTGRFGPANCIS
jgi:hypothetical protein